MKPSAPQIKARLKKAIKENRKLNQKVVANRIGMSQGQLSDILNDRAPGTFEQILKIAEQVSLFEKTITQIDTQYTDDEEIESNQVNDISDENKYNWVESFMSKKRLQIAYIQAIELNDRYRKEILELKKEIKKLKGV